MLSSIVEFIVKVGAQTFRGRSAIRASITDGMTTKWTRVRSDGMSIQQIYFTSVCNFYFNYSEKRMCTCGIDGWFSMFFHL